MADRSIEGKEGVGDGAEVFPLKQVVCLDRVLDQSMFLLEVDEALLYQTKKCCAGVTWNISALSTP